MATERAGVGNVLPYGMLQGYSAVILLLIALVRPSRYTRGQDIYWVFAAYAISKLLELLDRQFLALGNLVSGHTLKHLAAAVAGLVVCRMLMLRTLREPGARRGTTGATEAETVLARLRVAVAGHPQGCPWRLIDAGGPVIAWSWHAPDAGTCRAPPAAPGTRATAASASWVLTSLAASGI